MRFLFWPYQRLPRHSITWGQKKKMKPQYGKYRGLYLEKHINYKIQLRKRIRNNEEVEQGSILQTGQYFKWSIFKHFKSQNQIKSKVKKGHHLVLFALAIFFINSALIQCSSGRDEFQVLKPESDAKLTQLLNNTPDLRQAFSNIDPIVFNEKMSQWIHRHPNIGVKSLAKLAVLSKDKPVLPKILDHISYDIAQLTDQYENNRDDFENAWAVGTRILDVDASTMKDSTELLAEIVKWTGDRSAIFPDSLALADNKFPSKVLWRNCNDSENLFMEAQPKAMESGRSGLFTLYDALRLAHCIYDGGVDVNSNEPGAFMRAALSAVKDAGDVELRMANLIRTFSEDAGDIQSMEQSLADWLTRDPDKVEITDYMVDHLYSISRKNFIFEEGKPLLDLQAAHMAYRNPTADHSAGTKDDRYLFQWLLKSLNADSAKFADLENFSPIDTTNRLYKFGKDIITHATYGLREVFKSGATSGTYAKSKLDALLWNGRTYNGNGGNTPFKGILFRNSGSPNPSADGPIARMAQVTSSQTHYNHYRQQKSTRLGSLLNVSQNYQNETMLAAILKNVYYHLMDQYYDHTLYTDENGVQKPRGWAMDTEDAQNWFGNPERNLPGYIASLQYSLRNMIFLNPCGKNSGQACPNISAANSDYSKTPYLTAMFYMLAASNGVVDPSRGPAVLDLKSSLLSMGANVDYDNGIRKINLPMGLKPMNVRVACPVETNVSGDCDQTVWRNNIPATTNLNMFDFELVSPGRFRRREGSITGDWHGRFRAQQGDVETTNSKTANWVMAEMALNAWRGYGPYTVNGKAPNGSQRKYTNDYYTDKYRTLLCKDATGLSAPGTHCQGTHTSSNAMGGNNGKIGGSAGGTSGSGNYHIYEKIYIPEDSNAACWAEAVDGGSYPKYGFIRPENSTIYYNNSYCSSWVKIKVDFNSLQEAVRANVEWLMYDKKYVFVIPMYGVTNMNTVWNNGASFSVFATINANGVYGVTTARRGGSNADRNGYWPLSGVNMGANSKGYINNSGNGFIAESNAEGASKTVRYGVTSFTGGDYTVILDLTYKIWGLSGLLVDVYQEIWNTLGDGPVTPPIVGNNFAPLLSMASEKYKTSDLMSNPGDAANESMAKFSKFYNDFFPDDSTTCTSGNLTHSPGGGPDLFENFVNGCLKANELPPLPKVKDVRYPESYNSDGSIKTWYTYTEPSEAKMGGFLLPLVMIVGTIHEDGGIRKTNGQLLAANENPDNITIRNFEKNGFREHVDTLLELMSSLNEAKKTNMGGIGLADNLPAYNTTASQEHVLNLLVEKSKGARNGLLTKVVTNRYANVANMEPLIDDIEELISKQSKKILNEFELTKDDANPSGISNKDKFRYFSTKKVIDENVFPTNYLGASNTSAEPISQLISFLGYLRKLTNDAEIKTAIKKFIPVLNKYIEMEGLGNPINLTDKDIDNIIDFLHDKTDTEKYTLDSFLNLIVDLKLNDIDTLRDFKFDKFKDVGSGRFKNELENMNTKMASYFGTDYKKEMLYSSMLLGEPKCAVGSDYYDANENGKWDRGIMSFVNNAYYENKIYTETPSNSGCEKIEVKIPDIYEPNFYVLNIDNVVWYFNDSLLNLRGACSVGSGPTDDVDCEKKTYVLNMTEDLYKLDYATKIVKLKNDIIKWVYDQEIEVPNNDRNNNNIIETGEFSDICNNGVFTPKTNLRNFLKYYISGGTPDCAGSNAIAKGSLQKLYADISDTTHGGYLLAFNQSMDEIFNPNCTVSTDCYKSARLVDIQKRFYNATNFEPNELKAFKNFIGKTLYDHRQEKYTYPISGMAPQLATLMAEFKGDYPQLLEMMITGFEKDGFLTYVGNSMGSAKVDSFGVLRDMRTFVNTKAVREYDNENTFWWQLSGLLSSISETAYKRHNMVWREDYHGNVSGIFRE